MITPSASDKREEPSQGDRHEASLVEIRRLMLRLRRLGDTGSEGEAGLVLPDPGLMGHYYVG